MTSNQHVIGRNRRIKLSAITALLAKGASLAAVFFTIPATLEYLGPERFGLWMAISSLMAMLSFADLGIGNGLLTSIAGAQGREDERSMLEIISSASGLLVGIALIFGGVLMVAHGLVDWAALMRLTSAEAVAAAPGAVGAMMLCFVVSIPVSMVQKLQLGLQLGYISNLWQVAGSMAAIAAVLLAIRAEASLSTLILAYALTPILVALLNAASFFVLRKALLPRWSRASLSCISRLTEKGALFFVLQLAAALTYASDSFVIARVLGAEEVAPFAVSEKMFSVVQIALSALLLPLWSAYSEALARKDVAWVRSAFRRAMLFSVVAAAILSSGLYLGGPMLLSLWTENQVAPPAALLLGLWIWKIIEAAGNSLAIFLNATDIVMAQVVVATITATAGISLKFILVDWYGVAGAVWATIIAFTIFSSIPYAFLIRRFFSRMAETNA